MGQWWKVIAPEKQAQFDWTRWGDKLSELLFNGAAENLIIHLAVPQTEGVEKEFSSTMPLTFRENPSTLVNLPTEMLEEIISHLCIGSLFCLATCSQFLFYLCRNRIVSLLKSQCGGLAGTSLICVGDYLAPDDYPPGSIPWRSKMEKVQKTYQDKRAPEGSGPATQKLALKTLYDIAGIDFSVIEKPNGPAAAYSSLSSAQSKGLRDFLDKLPRPHQRDLEFLMHFDHEKFYPKGPEWVLRNLTTKEFVRCSVVAYGSKTPFTGGGFGIGEVLLARICWSSDPHCLRDNIHRGIWAGHKFDIVVMDAIEGEVGWEDVSQSAFEEIKGIWKWEYGQDWEKEWKEFGAGGIGR